MKTPYLLMCTSVPRLCLFTARKLSLRSLDKAVHNLPQVLYGASKSLILKDK